MEGEGYPNVWVIQPLCVVPMVAHHKQMCYLVTPTPLAEPLLQSIIGETVEGEMRDDPLMLYYVKVMKLFEQVSAPDMVINVATEAAKLGDRDCPSTVGHFYYYYYSFIPSSVNVKGFGVSVVRSSWGGGGGKCYIYQAVWGRHTSTVFVCKFVLHLGVRLYFIVSI